MITARELRLMHIITAQRKLVIAPGRTHKASSAESILRHCLRQLGFTRQFRRGELSGKQHLELLESIREYGRAWLRHEAQAFADRYLAHDVREGRHLHEGLHHGAGNHQDDSPRSIEAREALRGFESVRRAIPSDIYYHIGRFFRRAKNFIRELIVSGAMAMTGNDPLSGADLAEADRLAGAQDDYFDRFRDEIIAEGAPGVAKPFDLSKPLQVIEPTPSMTPPQFVARAEMYGTAVWGAAQSLVRKRHHRTPAKGLDQERRIHGFPIDDQCQTCSEQTHLGWQPLGTLLDIGDSECLNNCHCYFIYRKKPLPGTEDTPNVPEPEIFVGGKPITKKEMDEINKQIADYVPSFNIKVTVGSD